MGNSSDLQAHRFKAFTGNRCCALVYLKSFVDIEQLNKSLLSPLLQYTAPPMDMQNMAKVLPYAGTQEITSFQEFCQALAWGQVVLLVSGFKSALQIPLKKYEQRSITEPENEKLVRGPRDSFVESIWSNIGLIRQRIKNPDFRIEMNTLGTKTSVELGIVYVEGIANREIVDEVRHRLKRIDIDRLLSSGAVNEFISDSPLSPFPTYQHTERPDRLTSALLVSDFQSSYSNGIFHSARIYAYNSKGEKPSWIDVF